MTPDTSATPWHVSVIVPARNEEQLLRRCLRSVKNALAALPCGVTRDLIVIVDSSTDQTWQIAKEETADCGCVARTQAGMVGRARAIATELALRRHPGPHDRWWLANTDADCIVPKHWLTQQVALASEGIDAIAGTVDVDSFEEHLPIVQSRFRATYLISADGTHPHIHGANVGFRADAYLRAGGWGALAVAEDHELWKRLTLAGAKKRSVSQIEVVTSGRRHGRAPHGFAEALAAHNEFVA